MRGTDQIELKANQKGIHPKGVLVKVKESDRKLST